MVAIEKKKNAFITKTAYKSHLRINFNVKLRVEMQYIKSAIWQFIDASNVTSTKKQRTKYIDETNEQKNFFKSTHNQNYMAYTFYRCCYYYCHCGKAFCLHRRYTIIHHISKKKKCTNERKIRSVHTTKESK